MQRALLFSTETAMMFGTMSSSITKEDRTMKSCKSQEFNKKSNAANPARKKKGGH